MFNKYLKVFYGEKTKNPGFFMLGFFVAKPDLKQIFFNMLLH